MKQKYSWEKSSIVTKHKRIRKRLENSKPLKCPLCNEIKKLELSNKDHNYYENKEDWWYLCHKCHRQYDMRHDNFKFKKKFDALFSNSYL